MRRSQCYHRPTVILIILSQSALAFETEKENRQRTGHNPIVLFFVCCSFVENITAGGESSLPLEREPVAAHHPGAVGALHTLSSEPASGCSDRQQSQG